MPHDLTLCCQILNGCCVYQNCYSCLINRSGNFTRGHQLKLRKDLAFLLTSSNFISLELLLPDCAVLLQLQPGFHSNAIACVACVHATNASASQYECLVEAVATMIGCLPTQALAFLAVFVYATHATQAIAFEWKPGFSNLSRFRRQLAKLDLSSVCLNSFCVDF